MKFKFAQNHTVIQTIKNKMTGATNRFVVCKFDDKGELETKDPKIIYVLQNKLPGCTWEGKEVEPERVRNFLSDDDLKEEGIKSYADMSYQELQVEYAEITGKSGVGKKKKDLLTELEG